MIFRRLVRQLQGNTRRSAILVYPVICFAIIASFLFHHSFHRPLESLGRISNLDRPPLLPDAPGYTQGLCEDAPGWNDWASKYVISRIGKDIVLTNLNWDYVELGFNLYNKTTTLGLDIVLVAEDCNVYKCLSHAFGHSHILPPLLGDRDADAQNFNTEGFGRMVSVRPVYMHFFLNRGVHVIWEDLDSFPLDNLRKYWTRGADITAVDDSNTGNHYDSSNLCSCLIFSQATPATLFFLETWMSMMDSRAKTNQGAFNNALKYAKSDHGLTLVILPRTLFPNGATLDANNATAKWVHANYRVGKQNKIEFLMRHGMDLTKFQETLKVMYCEGVVYSDKQQKTMEDTSFAPKNQVPCSSNGMILFERCFCFVGYGGSTCSNPWNSTLPTCGPYDDRCFYHPEYGVAKVTDDRWRGAQRQEDSTWAQQRSSDRNEEHMQVFQHYSTLLEHGIALGDVIEFGAGPFTQSLTIFDETHLSPSTVTLVEPMAEKYMKTVNACRYKNGSLGGFLTKILPIPIERYSSDKKYDTVVAINFIEHVQDAFLAYQKVINSLKEGGVLIFHERFWPDYKGIETENRREFDLHPIRLSSRFGHWFATEFEILFEREQAERWGNLGHYWIGRKVNKPMMSYQTKLLSDLQKHNEDLSQLGFNESNIWGNIFNAEDTEQGREYMSFVRQPWVKTVCEVGFAAGHSSIVYHSANPRVQIFSFDDFGKEMLTSEAIKLVQRKVKVEITRGDSRKTLIDFKLQSNVTCDIISIDGAHHADFPSKDMANFKYLSDYPNIVLIDDYHKSDWPAVHSAVETNVLDGSLNLLHSSMSNVFFRGKEKAWAVAQYDLITVICASHTIERIENLQKLITSLGAHPLVQRFILIWQGKTLPLEIKQVVIEASKTLPAKITLVEKENSLNNRYDPSLPVTTRAVLILDDDLLVPSETVSRVFKTWKLNPMQVHSFGGPRIVSKSGYVYNVGIDDPRANFLLPRFLFHRKLMDAYYHDSNKKVRQFVDEHPAHCDDIAFALVTSKFTGHPLHYVEGKHEDNASPGLGHQADRIKLREECSKQLVNLVGTELKPIHRTMVS